MGAPSWRQRQAASATRWVCMENARPVEPQARASRRTTAQISAYEAPPPPSSAGTWALKKPSRFRSS